MQPPCCYFTQNKELLHQSFVFFKNQKPCTSLYGPIASAANVDPNSQVCAPAMLVLQIVGNCKE
jgi:hypothetical protein